jgi:hypothetical protein
MATAEDTSMKGVIAFSGQMYAGKTTSAEIVRSLLVDSCILSMAAPLKNYARLLGWNGEKDKKGRRLLQLIGTECGRECIDQDIWVKKWWETASKESGYVIVDDLRFQNEYDGIRSLCKQHGVPFLHIHIWIRKRNLLEKLFPWTIHKSERGFKFSAEDSTDICNHNLTMSLLQLQLRRIIGEFI